MSAHLTLTFSKISLTSLNGMANGRRSPMPKPFAPFGAGPPYARPAPPTKSFYAPCLPSKRALLPQLTADRNLLHPQSSTPRTSSLPTRHPSQSPSSNSPTGTETSPDSPSARYPISPTPLPSSFPPPPATGSRTQHMFPLREVAGPEGPT